MVTKSRGHEMSWRRTVVMVTKRPGEEKSSDEMSRDEVSGDEKSVHGWCGC